MNPYKNLNLKKFLNSISQDEFDRENKLQDEKNKKVHKEFLDGMAIGKCFLCYNDINSFKVNEPCFHWFLYPVGIRKKHFEKYLETPIGFYNLDSYFRWLANTENFIVNINDLKDETSKTSFLETTFRHKNIEWAFSIGYTDIEGHLNAKVGDKPHFHIQMIVDNRIFLKFNDFHIPFSEEDLFMLELFEQNKDKLKLGQTFGLGISVLEDKDTFKLLEKSMIRSDDYKNAPFNRQTIVQAPKGKKISGEVLQQAYVELNLR